MPQPIKAIPEGFHTITPHLVIRGAAEAIEFYKKALGAEERMRMASPDGRITHAELKIGDSILFLADEFPEMGGTCSRSPQSLGATTVTLMLYVPDVDTAFKRAIDAGAKSVMPVADMFWGDRYGTITDPYGHTWGMATQKEVLTPIEVERRAREFFAKMQEQKKSA